MTEPTQEHAELFGPPQCRTCRYFTEQLSKHSTVKLTPGVGECRRNAPRGPVSLGWQRGAPEDGDVHVALISAFPPVPADDWCGEHAPRPLTFMPPDGEPPK